MQKKTPLLQIVSVAANVHILLLSSNSLTLNLKIISLLLQRLGSPALVEPHRRLLEADVCRKTQRLVETRRN